VGRLGDMFGRIRMYNFGFALFTLGSLLCGISVTGFQLISFRVVQGLGGALVWLVASEHVSNLTNIGLNIHSDMLCDTIKKKHR
jgi:MFS family permease